MEFKPETESNRHPVVSILKKIGKIAGLLIIGEYSKEYEEYLEQLPRPEKPRKTEYIHFAVLGKQGERPSILEVIYYDHDIFERATWPQSNSPEGRTK